MSPLYYSSPLPNWKVHRRNYISYGDFFSLYTTTTTLLLLLLLLLFGCVAGEWSIPCPTEGLPRQPCHRKGSHKQGRRVRQNREAVCSCQGLATGLALPMVDVIVFPFYHIFSIKFSSYFFIPSELNIVCSFAE